MSYPGSGEKHHRPRWTHCLGGEAYARGWEGIDWGRDDAVCLVCGATRPSGEVDDVCRKCGSCDYEVQR